MLLSFFEVSINRICAFFNRLPFDISNAPTTNKKIDQIPNSFFGKILASIKKFKKPNRVPANLWRIDSTIGIVMCEDEPPGIFFDILKLVQNVDIY